MDGDRPRSTSEIFQALWGVDPARRREEFVRLCGDDPELWNEIESLLRHARQAEASDFLPEPPLAAHAAIPDESPTPGTRIGPYEILRQVGRGGMGAVYHARRVEPYEQPVAIKIIRNGLDESFRRRFQAERRLLAKLEHPDIVRLLDGGATPDGLPFLVMEYVDGRHLDAYCEQEKVNVRGKASLLVAVARAVAYAHEKGVLHRDLKPGNVLVTKAGALKITDFGLARSLQPVETSGATRGGLLGTPGFMSPEQVRGGSETAARAVDVYGLGATFYAVLTGRPPFLGETPIDTYLQIANEEPVSPSRLLKGLPKDVETICLRCLEKDPARRYPDATALVHDLEAFLDGRPISARPIGPVERSWRWCRRRPALAAAIASLSAVILGSLCGISWLWAAAREQRDRAEANLGRVVDDLDRWYSRIADRPELRRADLASFRRDLFEAARDELDQLAREVGPNPRLRNEHARTSVALARIRSALGDGEAASAAAVAAVEEAERALQDDPDSPESQETLLTAIQHDLMFDSDPLRTARLFQKAERIYEEESSKTGPGERRDRHLDQRLLNAYNMACRELDGGRPSEADRLLRRVCAMGEMRIAAGFPADNVTRATAAAYSHLCDLEAKGGRRVEAEKAVVRSADILKKRLAERPHDATAALDFRIACGQLQGYLTDWGRYDEATARTEELCSVLEAARTEKRPAYERLEIDRALLREYDELIRHRLRNRTASDAGSGKGAVAPNERNLEPTCRKAFELAVALRTIVTDDADVDYLGARAAYELSQLIHARNGRDDETDRLLTQACELLRSGLQKRPEADRSRDLDAYERAFERLHEEQSR